MQLKTIGRVDKVDLPLLNLYGIEAKIDTGADSCSIHCHDIQLLDAESRVRFRLLDPEHPEYNEKEFELDVARMTSVKSSSGYSERRVFIKSRIEIFGKSYSAEISLTDRQKMKFPMLLGRSFLKKRFVVDVAKKYLSHNQGVNT